MTVKELIRKIDKKDKRFEAHINWNDLLSDLQINEWGFYSDESDLKAYWIRCWYCTDTYVGIKAYFLKDKFVAISSQYGRKMDEEFEFDSEKSFEKVRKYVLSLIKPNYSIPFLHIKELGDFYNVEYQSQLTSKFHKEGVYNDKKVIVKRLQNTDDYPNFHDVKIIYEDGKSETVDCRKISFEYCKVFDK